MSNLTEKYPALTGSFLRGSTKGQIASLYKNKEKTDRIEQFKNALVAGDITIKEPLSHQQVKKMVEMGIQVPESLMPKKAEKPAKTEKAPKAPKADKA